MAGEGPDAASVPVQFTEIAAATINAYPQIASLIKSRVRELAVPNQAEQLGHQCTGELKRCRTIHLGTHHRLIYTVREHDVVVVAIGKRRAELAYGIALRAIKQLPPPPKFEISNIPASTPKPRGEPPKRKKGKKPGRRRR